MRIGIAHHFGWAVAITASPEHEVIDRRRIELIDAHLPAAPIHHVGGPHEMHRNGEPVDDTTLAALVADVRASAVRCASAAFDAIAASVDGTIEAVCVRAWPASFPDDIAVLRRVPYESRADSVMYCRVLAEAARDRGWEVRTYDAKTVERDARQLLGAWASDVLDGPRRRAAHRRRDHRRAVGRNDHAGRAGSLGAAGDGTQVAGIGDPVETDEQRACLPRELERIRVPVRLDASDNALVVAGAGCVGQLALGLDVNTGAAVLSQPLLGGHRALGRPELQHLPRAAQRFPHRSPAVDLLRGHRFGTSR